MSSEGGVLVKQGIVDLGHGPNGLQCLTVT